jgi:tetratricopeptide (TPR) repeat protein
MARASILALAFLMAALFYSCEKKADTYTASETALETRQAANRSELESTAGVSVPEPAAEVSYEDRATNEIQAVSFNIQVPAWTLVPRDEILDANYYSNRFPYSYDDITNLALASKEYYYKANDYRDKNDYPNALINYEIALSMYDWGAFYYQYGVCLMDMGDYENAEKAFKKAARRTAWDYPYEMIAPYYRESGRNPIYSFDNNGIVREKYFSYYNLACIYSLAMLDNWVDNCRDNLFLAIEYGYPYYEHIFSDPDLENFFNTTVGGWDRDETISIVYGQGFWNNVSGRTFAYRDSPNDFIDYEFVDGTHALRHDLTSDDLNRVLHGTYKITNNHIIIYYTRVTGAAGYGETYNMGVNTGYEHYRPYDRSINETDYLSLKQFVEENWMWQEKR